MAEQGGNGASARGRGERQGRAALLIVDMVNDQRPTQSAAMRLGTIRAAGVIARLRAAAALADVPVVFVNDHFGQWHSDKNRLVDLATGARGEAKAIAQTPRPGPDDYFVIKPQFSGFYATNLPVLLPRLGISRLILSGIATDICVLFTAADAHMRDYRLWVPQDAVVGTNAERHNWALELMRQSMSAEIRGTDTPALLDDWLAPRG